MNKIPQKPAILLLEDGRFFLGKSAGVIGTSIGRLTYHTGMTGHQKTITDPANQNAILVMTTTHIGNTGIQKDELENENVSLAGLVVKNFSEYDSRSTGGMSLQQFLEEQNTVAIRNVDTRAVVRHLRKNGSMRAIISSEETELARLKEILEGKINDLDSPLPPISNLELGHENSTKRIAVIDLGTKKSTLDHFIARNCKVKLFSLKENYEDMSKWNPDAFAISHGPLNQNVLNHLTPLVNKIISSNKPVIALGHGFLAIGHCLGLRIESDKIIHNGLNHSVKNLISGKAEITSQNFKFIASTSDLLANENIQITHRNINDDTIVGFRIKNKPIFAVLYNPEGAPGPRDSLYQFDDFIEVIDQYKKEKIT